MTGDPGAEAPASTTGATVEGAPPIDAGGEPIDLAPVEAILERLGRAPRQLIPILQAVQAEYRYLPAAALRYMIDHSEITAAQLYGVATFYGQFRLRPAGRHTIAVCVGTACHVKGADRVTDAFRRYLGIADNEDTDAARAYTVETVGCLGCCMLAVAVRIGGDIYGHVTPDSVGRVLAEFEASLADAESTTVAGPAGEAEAEGEARICLCSSCLASGSLEVRDALLQAAADLGVCVRVKSVGCSGMSYLAPLVEVVEPGGATQVYRHVQLGDVRGIIRAHFGLRGLARRVRHGVTGWLDRLLTDEAWTGVEHYAVAARDPVIQDYVGPQRHIATDGLRESDPLDLAEYRRKGGFEALAAALREGDPAGLRARIEASGVRGRGGAGFPTGAKMAAVVAAAGEPKYVVINGDEGDPGAFMDRMLLESAPFRVLEGMLLAAYAVGATKGYLYVRSEYPIAVNHLREALAILRAAGILGQRVLGGDFDFEAHLKEGAGAFVCGEETALLESIAGRRGTPRIKPPYPAQVGLFGRPTLIQNVETACLLPWIARHGGEAFRAIGTEKSPGTKVFALAGKVERGGLIEVPMGVTIREVVDRIGGGVPEGRAFKAVQIGGPSGGCVPAALADTPIDYERLAAAKAIMGSGGIVVLDETDCMVDMARYFLAFTQAESCGRCTPCRIGTRRMLDILEGLCEGTIPAGARGRRALATLEELAGMVKRSSLCGLGQSAPNPVLSTLTHFRAEYEAHLAGRCPAGSCKALIRYAVTARCIGCTRCAQVCPVEAIAQRPYQRHEVDDGLCTRCDACRVACPVGAIVVEDRGCA